ncbi:nitrate reductase molybdenum cofactor assembly chaperone [Salisediminibacterium beveridgei]|uniref:Respiratory nitrate reductase delta chain n=1 Tax=Salisediminibacterium beveridgei TaxID=632773 RepID=A0A1D7QT68_9BACI|nr:nitrate reductase molybdenum cofactor assembly chaperone [Salisediminibacterium beveridgei]AOM82177.1 Respiratory nitrate reductase delta chain [Salisediminibacterium beveridgei]
MLRKKAIKADTVYSIISYLLQYPSKEITSSIAIIKETIGDMEHPQLYMHFSSFFHWVTDMTEAQWEDHYIQMFDFGKKTNLYISYDLKGEDKERGTVLLNMKQAYQAGGFKVDCGELPDYLPMMLEFCAHAAPEDRKKLIETYFPQIKGIREGLVEAQSGYTFILDALLVTLENDGIRRAA